MGIYEKLESLKTGEKVALIYKKQNKRYEATYKKLIGIAKSFSLELEKLGLKKGESLVIFLPNSFEWVVADLAGLRIGAKIVPVPKNISNENLNYILKDSKAKIIVTDKKIKLSKIKVVDVRENKLLTLVSRHLLCKCQIFPEHPENPTNKPHTLVCGKQKGFLDINDFDFKENLGKESKEKHKIDDEDIATICYTSGSTGKPKGVMLTHKNILSNIYNQPFDVNEKDVLISYLPLSHMFERTCGYYAALFNKATIVLCEDYNKLLDYCEEFKPTILLTIPRIIEKINNKLEENKSARILSKIPLVRKIVGRKLKKRIGGKLRFMVCGGAPLGELGKKFWSLGIKIYEGYGMTETSPVISTNYPGNVKFGSVGKPLKNVKVKIENGRIYVKSPGLMKGYTSSLLTKSNIKDSWLDTGDLGYIDREGFLYIKGRADDCIVMSNGKKAFPEPLEKKLARIKGVEQAFVYGSGKSYLIALVYGKINKEELEKEIEKINKKLFHHEQIRKFSLIKEPFSIENRMLTHTLKLRRQNIYNKYKDLIEGMYRK